MALDFGEHTGGSDEILPLLTYNAKSGRFSTVEKVEQNGAWVKQENELAEADCVFVLDFPTARKGWLLFKQGMAPVKKLVPYDTPLADFPTRPVGDWGTDSQGKPILPRAGFVLNALTKDNKKREFASNARACIDGVSPVDKAYQAAPERAQGLLPVVKLVRTAKVGKNGNYQPELAIIKWVPRPAALGDAPSMGVTMAPSAPPAPAPQPAPAAAPGRVLVDDEVPF